MSLNEQFDVGSRIHIKTALANYNTTQDSAAADTTQDGITIDRQESGLSHYYSCKAAVSGAFQGGSSLRTASLSLAFEHSSDGTSWESFSTATNPTAVEWGSTAGAAGTTAGTEYNTIQQKVNLVTARRYVRISLPAPTFQDCSSGVVMSVHGVIAFGGADELPPS